MVRERGKDKREMRGQRDRWGRGKRGGEKEGRVEWEKAGKGAKRENEDKSMRNQNYLKSRDKKVEGGMQRKD